MVVYALVGLSATSRAELRQIELFDAYWSLRTSKIKMKVAKVSRHLQSKYFFFLLKKNVTLSLNATVRSHMGDWRLNLLVLDYCNRTVDRHINIRLPTSSL